MNFKEKCKKAAMDLSDYTDVLDFLSAIPEEYIDKYLNISWKDVDAGAFGELIDCCHFDDTTGFIEILDSL